MKTNTKLEKKNGETFKDFKERRHKYISIGEASLITGIKHYALRKIGDEKKIRCYKTPSGQRKFNLYDLQKMLNNNSAVIEIQKIKNNFLYTRISSKKQLDDLFRQIEYVRNYKPEYASYTLIQDIGSGINFKRKGIQTILDACLQRTIGEVVIAHKDRLSRFGFDLFQSIIEKAGGKITVIKNNSNKSSEEELAEDLLSIVHIFSCRQMGKRKYGRNSNENSTNPIIVK